jgi:hypothetical protein
MADRVAVMRDGGIEQVDRRQGVYVRPANVFVAGFIDSPAVNLVHSRIEAQNGGLYAMLGEHRLHLPDRPLRWPGPGRYIGKNVVLGMPRNAWPTRADSGMRTQRRRSRSRPPWRSRSAPKRSCTLTRRQRARGRTRSSRPRTTPARTSPADRRPNVGRGGRAGPARGRRRAAPLLRSRHRSGVARSRREPVLSCSARGVAQPG